MKKNIKSDTANKNLSDNSVHIYLIKNVSYGFEIIISRYFCIIPVLYGAGIFFLNKGLRNLRERALKNFFLMIQ